MTIIGEALIVCGIAGVGSYVAYRRAVSYHTLLDELSSLATESEKATALGIVEDSLDALGLDAQQSQVAQMLRRDEVQLLAALIRQSTTVTDDTTVSVMDVVDDADSYSNLYEFELALLANILSETSYFSTKGSHQFCIDLMMMDSRFDVRSSAYYARFAEKLDAAILAHPGVNDAAVLSAQLNHANAALAESQQLLAASQQHVAQLEAQIQALMLSQQTTVSQYTEAYQQAHASQQALHEKRQAHQETQQALAALAQELEHVKTSRLELEQHVRALEQQLLRKDGRIAELEDTVAQLQLDITRYAGEVTSLNDKLAARMKKDAEFEGRIELLEQALSQHAHPNQDGLTSSDTDVPPSQGGMASLVAEQRARAGLHRRASAQANEQDRGPSLLLTQ